VHKVGDKGEVHGRGWGEGGALRLRRFYWEPQTGDAVNIVHQVGDKGGVRGKGGLIRSRNQGTLST
jgi:hypothetical protein